MSYDGTGLQDSCADLIRQNTELLEERNDHVVEMDKCIKDLNEDNMRLKSSLVEGQRIVKDMRFDLEQIDPTFRKEKHKKR